LRGGQGLPRAAPKIGSIRLDAFLFALPCPGLGQFQVVSVPYPFFVNGRKATYFRVKVLSR
jgi:hypothetical protein